MHFWVEKSPDFIWAFFYLHSEGIKMETISLIQIRIENNIKQEIVALTMNVSKSAVSKIESKRMTSLPIDKLANYVESIGGELEINITLPNGEALSL